MGLKIRRPYLVLRLLIFSVMGFGLFWAADLHAQADSMIIQGVNGNRGDTVSVNIVFANHTDSVAALQLSMTYASDGLQFIKCYPTGRAAFMDSAHGGNFTIIQSSGAFTVLGYSLYPGAMPIGSDVAVVIRFYIRSTAPDGYYTVRFNTVYSSDNTWSNWSGSTTMNPTLVNGRVRVGTPPVNNPPQFTAIPSVAQSVAPNNLLQFTISGHDTDNDSVIVTASGLPQNATFPTARGYQSASGQLNFTPADSQAGHSYNVIFSLDDRVNTLVTGTVTINVTGGGTTNQPPVIITPRSFSVTEGNHLSFIVSASDPNGDFVTLSASNMPTHAAFPTATADSVTSSTFTFDPDFSQGGNVYSVTFTARDDHSAQSQVVVDISVIDVPNDFLRIAPNQGALPGSSNRYLIVNMTNAKPIYGLQFDLLYDPAIFSVRSAIPAVRAQDMAFFSELLSDGRYRVMIFSMGVETIVPGSDTIVYFSVDIDPAASFGAKDITFDSATSVQDSLGGSKSMIFDPGSYTVDRLGDANLDGLVSVGDCVAIVASLLQRTTLSPRAADAADFNRDASVRIADLMLVVNHILGRDIVNPPLPRLAGNAQLIRDGLKTGGRVNLPLMVSLDNAGAGVQFAINYDPALIKFHGMTPGSMVSGLRLDYQDTGSKIIGVIYDLDLSVFGPGSGELVNLDVETLCDIPDPGQAMRVTDFQIVDVDAQTLNIEVLGELPTAFSLNQNYPNPFNSTTVISFDLPETSPVALTVYNLLGQTVNIIENGMLEAGSHNLSWNGTDSHGSQVSTGVYFYRLQAKNFDQTKKMLLVK
jgi:hypothetical protein